MVEPIEEVAAKLGRSKAVKVCSCGNQFNPVRNQRHCPECVKKGLEAQQAEIEKKEHRREQVREAVARFRAKEKEEDQGERSYFDLIECDEYASYRLQPGPGTPWCGLHGKRNNFFGSKGPAADEAFLERFYEIEEFCDSRGLDSLKTDHSVTNSSDGSHLGWECLFCLFNKAEALETCRRFVRETLKMPCYADFQSVPVTLEGREQLCERFPNFGTSLWGRPWL